MSFVFVGLFEYGFIYVVQETLGDVIPIEVGRGVKKDSQIRYAMNSYDASYGIIVSNNTSKIKKKMI